MDGKSDQHSGETTDRDIPHGHVSRVPEARVAVRRSPKYGTFMALGVALGIVAALILTTVFDGTSEPSPFTEVTYSQTQAFGFILLWCIPAGIAVMMIVAMILDGVVSRRLRHATVRVDQVDER
ncbi:potassium transporter Trk [Microbacterium karelineae]|uniref:potassium transporter Trk n=1 Tax=Microbacterium karelineae TaxID=2654283 RepID=UPI001E59AFF1|nr:potassium transporter Trk [Microbacterium karelineae]